jgi:Fur family ferric uptake transcriptional regulator
VSESSLAAVLRSRGLRLTAQRQLVLEAVYELGHATLEELGLVTHAHLSHGAPTFHAVGADQHVHLVCRGCGGVTEVSPDVLSELSATLGARQGFRIDIGHVALFGLCAECGHG